MTVIWKTTKRTMASAAIAYPKVKAALEWAPAPWATIAPDIPMAAASSELRMQELMEVMAPMCSGGASM
jgi:hypothetical protein